MKIYFSGSIYGGRQKLETYKKLVKELQNYGEVLNPQVADDNVLINEKQNTDNQIFEDYEKKLQECDLVFAEVTIPSLGVGYEIGYADSHNKPIIAIYDKTVVSKVTTMLRGNKRIKIIPYTNVEEIINNIEEILKN